MDWSGMEWYGFHFIPSLTIIFLPLQFGRNEQLALFCPKISKQWNGAFVLLHSILFRATPLHSILLRSFYDIQHSLNTLVQITLTQPPQTMKNFRPQLTLKIFSL